MPIVIRAALPDDDEILALQLQRLNQIEWGISGDRRTDHQGGVDTLRETHDRIQETNGYGLVALLDGQIVGHLFLTFEIDNTFIEEKVRHYGYVSSVFVEDTARGRGVGKALMAEAERLTAARKLNRLMLYVLHGNTAAQAFYREFGFQPFGIEMMKAVNARGSD